MHFNAFWEWRKLTVGVEYVNGSFAHTIYIRLLFLTWVFFFDKKFVNDGNS